jgi:hypothetical protein
MDKCEPCQHTMQALQRSAPLAGGTPTGLLALTLPLA